MDMYRNLEYGQRSVKHEDVHVSTAPNRMLARDHHLRYTHSRLVSWPREDGIAPESRLLSTSSVLYVTTQRQRRELTPLVPSLFSTVPM